LRLRSTNPPANGAINTCGAICRAPSTPINASGSPSVLTAMIGSAVRVIRDPNALIACADHSRKKSA
jgi:hypothetical protein